MVKQDKKVRYFKYKLNNEDPHGRFTGSSPYQAASKVLSEIVKKDNNNTKKNYKFTLIETTKNSKKKQYQYEGKRIKLKKPIQYTIQKGGGEKKVMKKEFKNQLRKIKKYELKK